MLLVRITVHQLFVCLSPYCGDRLQSGADYRTNESVRRRLLRGTDQQQQQQQQTDAELLILLDDWLESRQLVPSM